MRLKLLGQLPRHIPNNRQHQAIIIIQKPLPLPLIRPKHGRARLCQKRLHFVPQPPQTRHHRLVIPGLGTQRQHTKQQLREPLRNHMRRGHRRAGGRRRRRPRRQRARQRAYRVAVRVHGALQARPQYHGGAVDVAVDGGDAAALQLEREVLREADAEEQAEGVEGVGDEVAREGLAEGKGRVEDVGEVAGYEGEGERRGEEGGEEGVLGRGVVDEGEVEVAEGGFEVVRRGVFFGEVGGEGGLVAGAEDVDAAAEVEGVVGRAGEPGGREDGGAPRDFFVPEHVVLVDGVELDFVERLFVARELVEVVPAHRVHVGEAYLASEDRLVPVEEGEQVLELEEILLLDDLRVNVRGSQGLDLRHQEVAYSLDRLVTSAGLEVTGWGPAAVIP